MVPRQIVPAHHDLVEDAAEQLGVLGLLEQKSRQIHLFLDAPLTGHDPDQGQQIQRHRFLASLEHGQQPHQHVLFIRSEPHPVGPVRSQIDVHRIPHAQLLGLVVELHGQAVLIQPC